MAYAALSVLLVFISSLPRGLMLCTREDLLREVKRGAHLSRNQITSLKTPGVMTCSRACLNRRICKSFSFNIETGECQLNSRTNISASSHMESRENVLFTDISYWPKLLAGLCFNHTCPFNSFCDPVNQSRYVCRVMGCLGRPDVDNGNLRDTHVSDVNPVGSVLSYVCDPGYIQSEAVCQDNGQWSSPVCVSASSCSMVKHYQPDSEDGEYWLRLTNFNNYTTRIYCHNMASSSPQEFLTLHDINYGIYPKIRNYDCDREYKKLAGNCKGQGGEIWFYKIRVNIKTMTVSEVDKTFANVTNVITKGLKYGSAYDCYTEHENNRLRCGTKGHFTIDLRGTGWRVRENQQWETFGWKPLLESIDRQMNGTVIRLYCGGAPGGCRSAGGLSLVPH